MSKYIFRNEKGGFESAYDKNSLMKLCYEEISDLEAKLAEKDRVCDKLQRDIECLEENYAQLESDYEKANELGLEPSYIKRVIKENEELKQQLADKDAEIQKWKSMAERSSSILDRFNYCGESIVYNTTRDQDKISFAVEKLVGVQKYISDNAVYLEEESFGREINDYIDNQIEELKKDIK